MKSKKILMALMCVTALAGLLGPTFTKVEATATVVDFETYISWSQDELIGTGSFSDSGFVFTFNDGNTNAIYADTSSGKSISFGDGSGSSTPTVTITKSGSGDFAFTDFSYSNASPALGLQITAKLDGSTLYTISSCATGSSGTETLNSYSELFGRVDEIVIVYSDTLNYTNIMNFIFQSFTFDAPNLVAPTIALSTPITGSGLNYTITDSNSASDVDSYLIQLYDAAGTTPVGSAISVSSTSGNIALSTDVAAGTNYTAKVKAVSADTANYTDSPYGTISSSATARAKVVSAIEITADPTNLSYIEGQTLDLSGMTVTLTYDDATTLTGITYDQFTANAITATPTQGDTLSLSDNSSSISVSCNSQSDSTTGTLTVIAKVVTAIDITAEPTDMSYVEGQSLDLSGMTVTLTFNDTSTITGITYDQFAANSITAFPSHGTTLAVGDDGTSITVSCNSQTDTTTGTLSVVAKAVTGIEVTADPTDMSYVEGQTLDLTGMTVTLSYNDSSTLTGITPSQFASNGITASPANGDSLTVAGNNGSSITVSCNSLSDTTTGTLSVIAKAVSGISVTSDPTKMEYIDGQSLDLSGIAVTLTYNDGSSVTGIGLADFSTYSITASPVNGATLTGSDDAQPVTVSCNAYTADTTNLTVSAKVVTSVTITADPTNLSYVEGNTLDLSGMTVTLGYNDASSDTGITYDQFAANSITASPAHGDSLTLSENGSSITVSCNSQTDSTTGTLSVIAKAVTGIEVTADPTDMSYVEGQTLDLTGMTVTLSYNDSSTLTGITPSQFASNGITASPANGDSMTVAGNDGSSITVNCNSLSDTTTGTLSVVAKAVSGISVTTNPTKLSYVVGESLDYAGMVVQLEYNDGSTVSGIVPADFTTYTITASPASGTIMTLLDDNTSIDLSCNSYTASTSLLTVVNKEVTAIEITAEPTNYTYYEGHALDLSGMTVKLTYNDTSSLSGITPDLFAANGIVATPSDGSALSMAADGQTISVTCNSLTDSTTGTLAITALSVTQIEMTANPTDMDYVDGQALDLTGMTVTLTYNDSSSVSGITPDQFVTYSISTSPTSGGTLTTADNGTFITVTCNAQTDTTDTALSVVARVVSGVEITSDPSKLNYVDGQTLDLSGLTVTLTYNDASTETGLTEADFSSYLITASPASGTTLGLSDNGSSITISCNSISDTTSAMAVVARAVSGVSVTADPTNMNYYSGDTLNLDGMTVTLTYNDATTVTGIVPADFASYEITTLPSASGGLSVGDDGTAIAVSCNSFSDATTATLSVTQKVATSLTITSEPSNMSYVEGQSLNLSGMTVTLTYNDSSTVTGVTPDQFTAKGITAVPTAGSALALSQNALPVTLSCDGQTDTTTATLSVTAKVVVGINIESDPSDLTYYAAQTLSLSGMKVALSYNDGTTISGITYDQFASKGISVTPANGTALTTAYNATPITVSIGAYSDTTANLSVTVRSTTQTSVQEEEVQSDPALIPDMITDETSGVILDLTSAQMPDNVTSMTASITVQNTSDSITSDALDALEADGSYGNINAIVISDIVLLDQDGNKITSFNGTVQVKIPIPEGFDGDLHVFWYDPDTKTVVDMDAFVVGDYLVFETSHFSYYAVVQISEAAVETTAVNETSWFDGTGKYIIIAAAAVMMLALVLLVIRKKRLSE